MAATSTSVTVGRRAAAVMPLLRAFALPAAVAAALFWIAYDGGSYDMSSWTTIAIAVWWVILLVVAFDVAPAARLWSGAGVSAAFLAAFAAFALASATWGASDERAIVAFDRDALYVGVFLLVTLLASRATLASWADAIAVGIAAVGVLALVSRLFPGLISTGSLPSFLPAADARLSYPLDYWNGLAIFLAVGIPLLLRGAAAAARPLALRAVSLGAVPLCATAIYLTSSRGGVAAAAVGTAVLVALAQSWALVAATAAAGVASVGAVLVVHSRGALLNGPLSSAAASAQGHSAAYLLLAIAVVTSGGLALAVQAAPVRRAPGRRAGIGLALAVVVVAAAIVAAAHPAQRLRDFRALPATSGPTVVGTHLLSGSGSGRWQFWTAAAQEFESAPLAGRGAGSFETWWTQHASFDYFVRNAHSLYLETLGELGVVGLVLLLAAFGVGIALGVRGAVRSRGDERLHLAGALGAFCAYAAGAALDWVWQLPAVTVAAIACLALAAGPAAVRPRLAAVQSSFRPRVRSRFGLTIATLLVAWFVIAAQASLLLAAEQLNRSQRLAAARDLPGALAAATDAHQIAPWSSQPLLQVALVQEERRRLPLAHDAIVAALGHDPQNWRLWLIRARIELEQGRVAAARRSVDRVRQLDPRSPLFR